MKRFDNSQKKIRKFIKYDKKINLNKYQVLNSNKNNKYKLSSVLIHNGGSIYSGHYYCYVRVSRDEWYLFNDHMVKKVNESEVLKQMPYLLFYERIINKKDVKSSKSTSKNSTRK